MREVLAILSAVSLAPPKSARQERNHRYYNKRLNSGASKTHNSDASKTNGASENTESPLSPSKPPPIAHAHAEGGASAREEPPHKRIAWDHSAGFTGLIEADYENFRQAYPACDLERQIIAAHLWLRANPRKSKKKNLYRFLTNWLERQQERGGDMFSAPNNGATTTKETPKQLMRKIEKERVPELPKVSPEERPTAEEFAAAKELL